LTYAHILPVANTAHGAGAVLGWLIGRAVLSRRRQWLVPSVGVLIVLFCLTPLYMPWNGRYDLHRGNKCWEKQDWPCALYWYRKAARALPENERVRRAVGWLELLAGEEKQPDE
jgi:hypothetical protein